MKAKTLIGLAALCSALSGCSVSVHEQQEQKKQQELKKQKEQEMNSIPIECMEILNTGYDKGGYSWLSCKDKDENIIFYLNSNWQSLDYGVRKLTLKKLTPEANGLIVNDIK